MSESVIITEDQTGPEAPQPNQDNSSARPEWLPEKFSSPEDLAKSYTELEKKLSANNELEDNPNVEEEEKSATSTPSFNKYADEFSGKGELSPDSFAELEKMGYPKEMVDTYIAGLRGTQSADADAVMSVAGGSDGYQELTSWAKDNMDVKELALYNQMVSTSTDNAKMAVEWLISKRESVEGVEPTLLSGNAKPAAKDEFRSTAEVVAAMKDKRYGKDTAYTKDVEVKLGRSKVF
jgi:hypothetical protein